MKKYLYLIMLLLMVMGTAHAENFPVAEGKTAILIGQDYQTIKRYLVGVGHDPAGLMIYTAISDMKGLDEWSGDYGAGTSNADKLLAANPDKAIQIGLYMVDLLKGTYAGKFDKQIEHLAVWINKVNVPVFLRIGYEFDGPHNHYNPDDYKKAYVYLVNKLNNFGVGSKVDYVWHSYANRPSRNEIIDIAKWYPGDEYVDWIGLSYFEQPQGFMTHVVTFAQDHQKPLMIAEATPVRQMLSGSLAWKIWFKPLFRFVEQNDVKIISYINSNWNAMPMFAALNWGDARIEKYDNFKKLWLEKINEERYQFKW